MKFENFSNKHEIPEYGIRTGERAAVPVTFPFPLVVSDVVVVDDPRRGKFEFERFTPQNFVPVKFFEIGCDDEVLLRPFWLSSTVFRKVLLNFFFLIIFSNELLDEIKGDHKKIKKRP